MKNRSLAKSRNRSRSVAQEKADPRISIGAVAVLGTISTLVGLWAVACFVGAMLATGGPLSLAQAWISAVTGG